MHNFYFVEQNRQKVKENAVIMCERLGKFRQAFAWTAIYLMNVINGISSLERDSDRDSTGSSSNTNSLGTFFCLMNDLVTKKCDSVYREKDF